MVRRVVTIGTVFLFLGTLVFVVRFAGSIPIMDEFFNLGLLTGEQPLEWSYLWSAHNEHRIPLPRLAYWAVMTASGYDFRSPMLADVLLLGAVAWLMLRVAERLRGRAALSDLCLPLLVLSLAQWENLLWNFQVQFVLSTVLTCIVLAVAVRDTRVGLVWHLSAGGAILLLPLCGAQGVALIPAFGLWLGWLAWRYRHRGRWGLAGLFTGLACSSGLLLLLYFHNLPRTDYHAKCTSVSLFIRAALQFLGGSLGYACAIVGPIEPGTWPLLGLLVAGMIALTAGLAVRSGQRGVGPLLFLFAMLSLTIGMAYGRASTSPNACMISRYTTLSLPLLCWLYLTWGACASRAWAACGQWSIALLALACWWPSVDEAYRHGREHRWQMVQLRRDIADGVPRSFLADRYGPKLIGDHRQYLLASMDRLRQWGKTPLAHVRPDVNFTPQTLALDGLVAEHMTPNVTGWQANSEKARLLLRLPKPQYVRGLRLSYRLDEPLHRGLSRIAWRNSRNEAFSPLERGVWNPLLLGQDDTRLIWLNGFLDEVQIELFVTGSELQLKQVELLQ